jgi:hypothetical protein
MQEILKLRVKPFTPPQRIPKLELDQPSWYSDDVGKTFLPQH